MNIFKSPNQIVKEIHNEVDTAQERILSDARRIISETTMPDESRIDRLKKAGFTSVEEVEKASKALRKKEKAIEQAKLVEHYNREYPFLKFLTQKELDRICKKYNLIHAPVSNYKKAVPEKNLQDIERAQKLKKGDFPARKTDDNWTFATMRMMYPIVDFNPITGNIEANWRQREEVNSQPELQIAAPKKHFNLKGMEKRGKFGFMKPEPKDPIVFRYVRGGVQVITKWGLESNDPTLANPIDN